MAEKKKGTIPRASILANVVLQLAAAVVILFGVNWIGFNYYERWDVSREQKFSLSDQTARALRRLEAPLKIVVYFSPTLMSPDSILYGDVNTLMREIQFATRFRDSVEVIEVDPSRDLTRARELQAKYKFGANENVIILDYDGRTAFIPASEMGEWDLSGQAPELKAFIGEQAFVEGLLSLIAPEDRKVYALVGHGEGGPGGDFAIFSDYLARQSLEFAPLELASADRIPEDCGALLILGAKFDLPERIIGMIREYWEDEGSVIVLLDPEADTPRLRKFLEGMAVRPLDQRILRTQQIAPTLIGILREVTGVYLPGSTITKRLVGVNAFFAGSTQPVEGIPEFAEAKSLTVRPLVQAVGGFWGEARYVTSPDEGVAFDSGEDTENPYIAFSVEKGAVDDENVAIRSSKLMVVGNVDYLTDEVLTEPNLDFTLSAINWMLDRSRVSGIAPKLEQTFQLNLTGGQTNMIALYVILVIPGCAAFLGLVTWWRRRQ